MRKLSYENEFYTLFLFHANQSHFPKNGFALGLALKQRHMRIRKWPINGPAAQYLICKSFMLSDLEKNIKMIY